MVFRFRIKAALCGTTCAAACFASLALLIAGCGGEKSSSVPKRTPQTDLPKLGDYMVPLHDGRLEVAPPKGWVIGSRKTGYVIWFKKSGKSSYPCILVSAEDYETPAGEEPTTGKTVTGKNVGQFASEIRDRLEESGKSAKGVAPVEVGSFYGVSYRRVGKTKQKFKVIVLARSIVQTAVDGQLYTFELRAPEDEFAAVEDAVLAVAAGAKFPKSETKTPVEKEPAAKKSAMDEPPAEEPAAKEPAGDEPPEKAGAKRDAEEAKDKAPKDEPKKKPAKKPEPPKKKPKKKPTKKKDNDSEFELLDDDEL